MRKSLLMLMLCCVVLTAWAQETRVSGKVINSAGEPVAGASVLIKGKSSGVSTNAAGGFTISINPGEIVVITSVGFDAQEIRTNGSFISATLKANNDILSDIVVIGYGTQRKATLTGSVSTIKGEDLIRRQVASTSNLLQGAAPGVTVTQQSGRPGADGASIRIRGIGSINAGTYPLVLVDNVEMSLDAIDPNVIESISVLKDAASTAIFGSRAANGVILVTTKRGKKGTSFSYNAFASLQDATNLPTKLTAVEHMELYNEALVNSGRAKAFTDQLILDYKNNPADNFRYFDTDWVGQVLSKSGLMQNHNIIFSTGGDKVNFLASGTYLNQQGLTATTGYKKYDLRMNADFKVNEKVTLRGDFIYNKSMVEEPGGSSAEFIIRQALGVPAIGAGKFADGQYGDAGQSNKRNPLAQAEASGFNRTETPSLIMKGTILYHPVKNLEFEAFVANNTFSPHNKRYNKNYNVYRPDLVSSTLVFDSPYPGVNSIQESDINGRRNNYLVQGTYTPVFRRHNFKLQAGFQGEDLKTDTLGASRTNLPSDQPYINVGTENLGNSGGSGEYALAGFFGRLGYNFDNKYLVEFNGRYDGSSRFSQALDKQWGFFPSVSAGWVISEEAFFGGAKNVFDYFKIRGSYGSLGNQNVGGYYPFASNLAPNQNFYFNNALTSGLALTTAPNNNLSWENSIQSDIGVDAALFRNRITITFDVFKRRLEDMLLRVPVPLLLGQGSPLVNAGSMNNTGWEAAVTYRDNLNGFRYNVTANFSDVKNKVDDLFNQELFNGVFISRVRSPLNSYYGYVAEGLFQTVEEVTAAPLHFTNTKPGDIRYKDVSGAQGKPDNKIDQFDRVVLGNNFPRYEYSLNANAGWKGFDINIFFQGVGKRNSYVSGTGAWAFYAADFIPSGYDFHKDRWTPENPDASYPRLTDGLTNNQAASSYWMKDGSYLRFKNLAIGYTLPASVISRFKITQLRFYLSGQNLATWDNYLPGFDPERNENDGQFYPIMRTTTIGVNLRF